MFNNFYQIFFLLIFYSFLICFFILPLTTKHYFQSDFFLFVGFSDWNSFHNLTRFTFIWIFVKGSWTELLQTLIIFILVSLVLTFFVLLSVAYFTLAERKILAKLQRREGPAVVGIWGLFQPLVDGLKLFLKEIIYPSRSNNWLFWWGPVFVLSFSIATWAFIPLNFSGPICDANLGLIAVFAFMSLNTYAIILSAWASNSKYSLLGCLRAVSQYLSYEILIGFTVLLVGFLANSFKLSEIVLAQRGVFFVFPLLPVAILFFIVVLAETGRTPFDLPEAESELVGGYHTEYSGALFAFFLVAEYSNILLMSCLWVICFWGGWLAPFALLTFIPTVLMFILKALFVSFFIVFIRAKLPRYRFDQLASLSWKHFLIFLFGFTFFFISFHICLDIIPINSYLIYETTDLTSTLQDVNLRSQMTNLSFDQRVALQVDAICQLGLRLAEHECTSNALEQQHSTLSHTLIFRFNE